MVQSARKIMNGVAGTALIATVILGGLPASFASASTTDSIYSYALTGSSSTVANDAAANSGVNLTLAGDWSQTSFGVHFAGDQVSQQSVAYGKPASGNTINVASNQSVGMAVRFKYAGPSGGAHCFNDSRNITQLGRFGAGLSQVKIQLSNCSEDSYAVYPECRMAGANSTVNDIPVASTQPLVNGLTYIARCYKAPDPVSGTATLYFDVTEENLTYGNHVTNDTYDITRTGTIQSTAYLSVANKYQLPTIANNTDQFVGDVSKVSLCQAGTTAAVKTCLETEIPDPTVATPTRQWVTNPGVETDLTQWQGTYGGSAYVDVSRSTAEAHNGSASIKVLGLTGASSLNSGFSDDQPDLVTNATAGETYNGSVWVKPDSIGQTIKFKLREWDSSNNLITDSPVALTAASTNWQEITNSITAAQSGTRLSFAVYAEDIDAGEYFYADDMSLSSILVSREWADNPSLDSNITGWQDTFNGSPYITLAHSTAQSHAGAGSMLVSAITGASNLNSGFSDDTYSVSGLEYGKNYHASVWVKPSYSGQQINLRLREWKWDYVNHVNVLVGDNRHIVTTSGTGWQKLDNYLTASQNDSDLEVIVYGLSLDPGDYFYTDDMSVTSLE
jgi:hypothetical protein